MRRTFRLGAAAAALALTAVVASCAPPGGGGASGISAPILGCYTDISGGSFLVHPENGAYYMKRFFQDTTCDPGAEVAPGPGIQVWRADSEATAAAHCTARGAGLDPWYPGRWLIPEQSLVFSCA